MRERLKVEDKNDGVETQRLQELYQWEQRIKKERQAKEKKDLMEAHLVGSQIIYFWCSLLIKHTFMIFFLCIYRNI